MYVDASTANQIAHDYQEITKDSALLIARLIKKLRSNNAIPKKNSHSVEIKVDNELVYKGETGKQPQVNKLTSDQLQMLEEIIGSASAKEVFVSVDGKAIYHSKSGFEKVNQLSSQLQPSGAVGSQLLQLQDANSEQEVRNLQVVVAARRILNTLETNEYESEKHHLKRDGSNIIVSSFDGQSEVARSQGGFLTGSASRQDVSLLSELDTKLNKEKAVEKSVKEEAGEQGERGQGDEYRWGLNSVLPPCPQAEVVGSISPPLRAPFPLPLLVNSLPTAVNSGNVSQEIEVE